MNSGTFVKGEIRPKQGKRGPGKITMLARQAIALVVDGNADKLQLLLDEIHKTDGPKAAFDCYVKLYEINKQESRMAEDRAAMAVLDIKPWNGSVS
jgi:hypothetical protein